MRRTISVVSSGVLRWRSGEDSMATREVDVDDEVSPSLLPTVDVAAVFASVISR